MESGWPEHHDPLFLGTAAGLCASVVRGLAELAAVALIPSYKSCARLAAGLFLAPEFVMSKPQAYVVGLEVDLIVGMVVGIVAVLILAKLGIDHLLLKGALGGAVAWVLFYGFLAADPVSKLDPSGTFLEAEVSLLLHIIFGVAVVWSARFLDRLGKNKAS